MNWLGLLVLGSILGAFPCSGQELPRCDLDHVSSSVLEILSNTQGVDFGPYLTNVLHSVKKTWYSRMPKEALLPQLEPGCVVISFSVLKDGGVRDISYEYVSGNPAMDRAAYDGINEASPFSPLPEKFAGTEIKLRFRFKYNPQHNADKPVQTKEGKKNSTTQ